jgi:hypothetical protein
VVDPRSHPGTGSVAAGDVVLHLLAPGFLALELRPEAAALEQGRVASNGRILDEPRLRSMEEMYLPD